jgi:hypothetical protein
MTHFKLSLALAVLTALASGTRAEAKEQFPRNIAQHIGAASQPVCGTCHEYGKTGGDTLITPFAWAMRARGMSGNASSVLAALDRMNADRVDSDGDGVTDYDELVAGTDPNSASSVSPGSGPPGDPQFGCAVAGPEVGRAAPLTVLFALSAWWWPRRGRPSRRQRLDESARR